MAAPWVVVDGGVDRNCRGQNYSDTHASYFQRLERVSSMAHCQHFCTSARKCAGINFMEASHRCELWEQPIRSSIRTAGSVCLGYHPVATTTNTGSTTSRPHTDAASTTRTRVRTSTTEAPTTTPSAEPPSTTKRATLAATTTTPVPTTTTPLPTSRTATTAATTAATTSTVASTSTQATTAAPEWALVQGSDGPFAVCLPKQPMGMQRYGIDSLASCKALCTQEPSCQGVEYNHAGAHCQFWDVPIEGGVDWPGSECVRYLRNGKEEEAAASAAATTSMDGERSDDPRWNYIDGGTGRACRGDDDTDDSDSYYILQEGLADLNRCKAHCANIESPLACYGIEHSEAMGRCEVWTRPVSASVARVGFVCIAFDPFFE